MKSQWIHSLPSCIWKIVLPTMPIESQWCCLSSEMDLHGAEPQFKDGSVYRQNRPARRDSNWLWHLPTYENTTYIETCHRKVRNTARLGVPTRTLTSN